MLTDDEMLEIEERLRNITSGRWAIYKRSKRAISHWITRIGADGQSLWTWPGFIQTSYKEDAVFIAHAPDDIRRLIEHMRELEESYANA